QSLQRLRRGDALDLRPVFADVGVARVQQAVIPLRLVAQEQQALGVGVEATDGIDVFGKRKIREGALAGMVGRELGEDVERFVERNQHEGSFKSQVAG